MERINANEVQSMMEAYASIYNNQEQEAICEEVVETEELQENQANRDKQRELRQQQSGGNRAQQQLGPKGASYSFADRRKFRRSASASAQANTNRVGQNIKVGSPTGPAQNQQLKKPAPAAPLTAQQKAYGPNSTLNKDQQAVNKEYDRLRKSDPEAAAAYGKKMAAAGAAKKDFSLPKPTQAQSNPTAAQKQASVDAAIKSVNTPEKMNKQAPAGTALRAQQDKQAAAKPAGGYQLPAGAKPKVAVGGNNPADVKKQPVGAATGSAPRPRPTGARPMGARNRMRMEEVDVFDTIKEYLIDEGATEEEALKQMLTLTDEQRTEILEGSCGSKKKKKSKKGGY